MKLQDLELSERDAAGLFRLLGKMGAGLDASRENSDLIRRTFGVTTRADSLDEKARSVEVVASTAALDSYDEIVEQDWDLSRYRANPVVLWAHNSVGLCGPAEDALPIGFASDVRVEGRSLMARLHFVTEDAAPMAEKVWQGFKQGSIRAVSVGFRSHKPVKETQPDGSELVRLTENELFEISACPIPANPEAVARSAERNRAQALRLAATTQDKGTKTMDAEKKIAELTAENEALKAASSTAAEALTESKAATEKALAEKVEAETRAQAAEGRAEKAEAQLNQLEVEKLVGKKLLPVEVPEFVELRATNRKLFDSMIEKRADLPHGKDVIPPDPEPKNQATAPGGSADLAELASKDPAGAGADPTDLGAHALGATH